LPTHTPTPSPTPETVTLYYISNPNDILGVFPVYPFNARAMYDDMVSMRESIDVMRYSLDGAHQGDVAACNNYAAAYETILDSGTFYDDVPGDWQAIDERYVVSFIYSLDKTRPAYLACKEGNRPSDQSYGQAYQALDDVARYLDPAIGWAEDRL